MTKRNLLIIFVIFTFIISACTRSASSAPAATATPKANFPKPVATSGMNAIEIAGTQTAIATSGLPMPTSASNVLAVTNTPLAGVNQTPIANLPTAASAGVTPFPTIPPSGNTPLPSPTTGSTIPTAILSTQAVNTPVVYATAAPVVKPATYVLHQGEYPYCLARRFNVNPEELLSLNGLSSSQSEYTPGTTISIPSSGASWPGTRSLKNHPVQYTVQTGDTIYSIACEFGDVDPMGIASVNGLSGDYSLTTGTAIQIP